MDGRVLVGLLEIAALSLAPVLLVSALVRMNLVYEFSLALGRRVRLLPVLPAGPPLERLVADLRRLRPQVRSPAPDMAGAEQRAIVTAYDATMLATARALDVPTSLAGLPEGRDRDAERLRLERALEQAGVSLRQD